VNVFNILAFLLVMKKGSKDETYTELKDKYYK